MSLFQSVSNFRSNRKLIADRAYGVIEARQGEFVSIRFRPWPKLISANETSFLGFLKPIRQDTDVCRVFYNQQWKRPEILALKFSGSTSGTSFATLRRALQILDEVARVKRTDAIIAHVSNLRISDRLMNRLSWEKHLTDKQGRHFIKRYHGQYPESIFYARPQTREKAA